MSLSKIESIVEALVPMASSIDVGVEPPGTIVIRVRAPGRPDDRARLRERLERVLAKTIEQQFRVDVWPPASRPAEKKRNI